MALPRAPGILTASFLLEDPAMPFPFRPLAMAACLAIGFVAPAMAKPPLRDVPEIDDAMLWVAVAYEIRDKCDSIGARLVYAVGNLQKLRRRANELGYTDDEIRAYLYSKEEQERMRRRGEDYIFARGADYDAPETFCVLGRAEIARDSAIGAYLRER
jgi:hypothetical protein